jgi:hypothetical protein
MCCDMHATLQCIQMDVPRQFTVHVVLWRIMRHVGHHVGNQ